VAVKDIVPVLGESFEQTLTAASPDLLREMIRACAQKMMDAEVARLERLGAKRVREDRLSLARGLAAGRAGGGC